MAEQVASCSPPAPAPEMSPSQFYSTKTLTPEGWGRATAKNTGTRPKGIIQALGLDRARVNNSSLPFLHRKSYLDQQLQSCDRMYSTDISGHHGCVNALAFSKGEQFLGTGGNDQRVLVWRVPEAIQGQANLRPICMSKRQRSTIFSIDFSCDNSFIFSGGQYPELIQHDFSTGQFVNSYDHTEAVYSVSAHPSAPEVVMTASEDGCVYIIDTRLPNTAVKQMMMLCQGYQSVAINPVEHRLVAVMNSRSGSSLYDTRKYCKQVVSYNTTSFTPFQAAGGVSVCFNSTGTKVFSTYRHYTPRLNELWESEATCYYPDSHGKYRNAVTMKSGCFMGQNDEYVAAGSDDFRVYIWKVPNTPRLTEEEKEAPGFVTTSGGNPHLVLPGHRSIVNQTRYSKVHQVLASSGVEKVVKLWSASPLNEKNVEHTPGDPPARRCYTSLERRTMMSNYSSLEPRDPTQEEPMALALFDSLVEEEYNSGSFSYQRYVNSGSDSDSEDFQLSDDTLSDTYGSEAEDFMDSSSESYGVHDHRFGHGLSRQVWAEAEWDQLTTEWRGGSGVKTRSMGRSSCVQGTNKARAGYSSGGGGSGVGGRMKTRSTSHLGCSNDAQRTSGSSGVEERMKTRCSNGAQGTSGGSGVEERMKTRCSKGTSGGSGVGERMKTRSTGCSNGAQGASGGSDVGKRMKTRCSNGAQGTSGGSCVGKRMKTRCSNGAQGTSGGSGVGERMKTRSTGCSNGAQGTSGGCSDVGKRMKTRCSNGAQGTSGGSGVGKRMKTRCSNGAQGTSGGSGVGERMKTRCSNGAQGTSGGSGVGERMKTRSTGCSNGAQGTSGGSDVGKRMKTRSSNGAQGTSGGSGVGKRMKTRCSNGAQGTSGGSGVGERMKTRCSNGAQGTSGGSGVGERMKTRSTSHLGCRIGAQGTKSGASGGGGGSGVQGVKKRMTDEKEACSSGSSGAKKMKTEAAGCSGEGGDSSGVQGDKTGHPAPDTSSSCSSSSNGVMGARTSHPWMAGLCPLAYEKVADMVIPMEPEEIAVTTSEVVQSEVRGGPMTTRSASKRGRRS